MSKFGEHVGITCDGCGVKPIIGSRFKCKQCTNHDFCEACFEEFNKGNLLQTVNSSRVNPISKRVEDHKFEEFSDKDFKSMTGASGAAAPKVKKQKPNDPCACGSGKKAKKCCAAGA